MREMKEEEENEWLIDVFVKREKKKKRVQRLMEIII